MPALEGGDEVLIGGQALLEGVMMRSPHAYALAVRKPSGELVTHSEPLEKLSEKHRWMGWPLIRGVATLGQAMNLGFRALRFSANVALEAEAAKADSEAKAEAKAEGKREATAPAKGKKKLEISPWMMAVNVLFSLGFFIFLYKFVPLVATTRLKEVAPVLAGPVAFNLVDGAIRIVLFLLFIWGVSLWADIKRVYRYHGAEHKTVFAFESRKPLTIELAQSFSTYHPRCGTSFLMTVMLISILFYALIPVETFWSRFAVRIALLPLIAGVSFEIIRFAAKYRTSLFALMTLPGLWMQRITTQPPEDSMVECAIVALDQSMELEKQRGGELVVA
ncbi:MAG: DUF1385 domain-containing protein [Acidobacteria bacterium]|nr:DUF1385 domain-containing protein [Acidobacteriota bacterium]